MILRECLDIYHPTGIDLCLGVFEVEYDAKHGDIFGCTEEFRGYWLAIAKDIAPTNNTLVTLASAIGEGLIKVTSLDSVSGAEVTC